MAFDSSKNHSNFCSKPHKTHTHTYTRRLRALFLSLPLTHSIIPKIRLFFFSLVRTHICVIIWTVYWWNLLHVRMYFNDRAQYDVEVLSSSWLQNRYLWGTCAWNRIFKNKLKHANTLCIGGNHRKTREEKKMMKREMKKGRRRLALPKLNWIVIRVNFNGFKGRSTSFSRIEINLVVGNSQPDRALIRYLTFIWHSFQHMSNN